MMEFYILVRPMVKAGHREEVSWNRQISLVILVASAGRSVKVQQQDDCRFRNGCNCEVN